MQSSFRKLLHQPPREGHLFLAKNPNNHWRHTLLPVRGRESIPIDTVGLGDFLLSHPDITAVKMDIEGSEVEIIRHGEWGNVSKLVFEYHFDRFPSLDLYYSLMDKLRQHFTVVLHRTFPPEQKTWVGNHPAVLVKCLGRKFGYLFLGLKTSMWEKFTTGLIHF